MDQYRRYSTSLKPELLTRRQRRGTEGCIVVWFVGCRLASPRQIPGLFQLFPTESIIFIKLEWFNCLLPLQQNMSPLVVQLELERERKRKLERKLKLSGGLMPVSPSSMRIRTV